jgi:hypothetical protein
MTVAMLLIVLGAAFVYCGYEGVSFASLVQGDNTVPVSTSVAGKQLAGS